MALKLNRQLGLRVSDEDLDRLNVLAEKLPFASKNYLARLALRIGIEEVSKNPAKHLLNGEAKEAR